MNNKNSKLVANSVHERAAKYGERSAYRYRVESTGEWISVSWTHFSKQITATAKAMALAGIKECDHVATYSQNMPEMILVDYGLFSNRAVSVPIYATSSPSQVEYIINDASVHTLFVGEQVQYDNTRQILSQCPCLKQLIVFSPDVKLDADDTTTLYFSDFLAKGEKAGNDVVVDRRCKEASEDDLALILYTSGTTGEPKGVMLKQSCLVGAIDSHDIRLTKVTDRDVSMSFLPLTHIFEKVWSYYCFHSGVEIAINLRPAEIQKTIKEVRPTLMCCVPRFWEKVYAGVQEKIASTTGLPKKLMLQAIEVGRERNLKYARLGKKGPLALELKYAFYDKVIFNKLRHAIGVDNANFFPTAGAMLSNNLNEFFHACGIDICYGYGLTETTATVSCFEAMGYEFGSVGKLLPGVEVKIGENNEILVKGKTITCGYYNKPEATAAAFIDGWFRTGDAGMLDQNGILTMTERIKELYKTANGKYIAPQAIEAKVAENKYVEQIMIVGDQRKFVSALIVPDYVKLEEYARSQGISFNSRAALLVDGRIVKYIQEEIDRDQENLAPFERIKRFRLLSKPFSMETGELTNTLKLKRRIINERYADMIEAMYID